MNLGSHIAVAKLLSPRNERLWLGSALPDLAAIGRFRLLGDTTDLDVRAGIVLHHLTDEVFHRHPWFTARQKRLRTALSEAGLNRGATRAIAHVGQELLLDGAMLEQTDLHQSTDRALGSIPACKSEIAGLVVDGADAWKLHLDKIVAWGTPLDYHQPEAVAERLHRILMKRSRLSFGEELIPTVAQVLATETESIFGSAVSFVSEIAAEIAALEAEAPA